MLYCTIHKRVYTFLEGWRTYTPEHVQDRPYGPGVVDGACDQCVAHAKAELQQQLPHLYAHIPPLGTDA